MVYRRKVVVKPSREKDEQPIGSLTMSKRERERKETRKGEAREEIATRRKGEKESNNTMQVTACAPHRPCLISFVPGVSSAFFPLTARQPWSQRRLSLMSHWNCSNGNECVILTTSACHSELRLLSPSHPPLFLFRYPSLFPFPSYRLLIHLLLFCSPQFHETRIATIFTVAANVYDLRVFNKYLRRYRSFIVITRYSFSMSVVPLCCF